MLVPWAYCGISAVVKGKWVLRPVNSKDRFRKSPRTSLYYIQYSVFTDITDLDLEHDVTDLGHDQGLVIP